MCAFALPACLAATPPDLIFHSGKIVTVDEQFSIAEALAVEGGRIVAVGSSAAVQALAGPLTRSIDLQGRTVLSGLIDTHTHPPTASERLSLRGQGARLAID